MRGLIATLAANFYFCQLRRTDEYFRGGRVHDAPISDLRILKWAKFSAAFSGDTPFFHPRITLTIAAVGWAGTAVLAGVLPKIFAELAGRALADRLTFRSQFGTNPRRFLVMKVQAEVWLRARTRYCECKLGSGSGFMKERINRLQQNGFPTLCDMRELRLRSESAVKIPWLRKLRSSIRLCSFRYQTIRLEHENSPPDAADRRCPPHSAVNSIGEVKV